MQWVFRPPLQLAIMVPLKNHDSSSFSRLKALAAQLKVLISIGTISMSKVKMSWQQDFFLSCNTFEKLHFTSDVQPSASSGVVSRDVVDKSMVVPAAEPFFKTYNITPKILNWLGTVQQSKLRRLL